MFFFLLLIPWSFLLGNVEGDAEIWLVVCVDKNIRVVYNDF